MNNKYRINIDGREVTGFPGQTILEIAKENEIFIPTLCYDERTNIYGSCGLCVVEVEGNPKLCKACATQISDGMVIMTNTDRVIESRKTNLELLLSNHVGDCRPPCVLTCPAHTDCQGYVGLIANKQYDQAIQLIKEKIPLPASIGRVCPHPCEKECRRGLEDEPIAILDLKRFAADVDLFSESPYIPPVAKESGKKVAIIGGGPMGLSAASFLRQKGHQVTLFEAMPKAGGMLRYGIPEYRLPKRILDAEIRLIEKMGVNILTNYKVGVDISFNKIREEFDAVLLGIGAWVSTGTGCPGEDSEGVIGGIDFLRKIVRNEPISLGDKVAIIGGGNTAMDACRSAVRLGSSQVYNIYRRTKEEMPADALEIKEAGEEGVIFKSLSSPLEILSDERGHVKSIVLQKMELGEPDASGRRKPIAIEGETETLEVDTVILAIGQAVDSDLFGSLEKTKKNGIVYDKETFATSIPGVFAGGDCGNDKISIAIEAIADAKKASDIIDAYLHGRQVAYEKPFFVERNDITRESFEDREIELRQATKILDAEDRKDSFEEVTETYLAEQAVSEANRCLECGCHAYYDCKLIDYANHYDVKPDRFKGEINKIEYDDDHPFIIRDPNKCILCGLCVRVCDEVMGIGALGLVHRGFDTVIKPTLEQSLYDSGCISCGQCVSVCPTGALKGKRFTAKDVPLKCNRVETICSYCSLGCGLKIEHSGSLLVRAVSNKKAPVNQGLLCGKGKWGFDFFQMEGRISEPLIKEDGQFTQIPYDEAFVHIAKKLQITATRYSRGAIAFSVSDRFTTEEAYVVKKLADTIGAKCFNFENRASGLLPVLGHDGSPNTIEELISTDVIIVVGYNIIDNPVMNIKLKQAADAGAKILLINPTGYEQPMDFAKAIYTHNNLSSLKAICKCIMESGKANHYDGYDELYESVKDIEPTVRERKIADFYMSAKKAMIVFSQNLVTTDAAKLIGDIALLSGHIGRPRDGILQLKAKNNSQGLIDLGINQGPEVLEGVKALVVFGEDPVGALGKQLTDYVDPDQLEFLAVVDTHMTKTGKMAEVFLPSSGYASTNGTFTNTEGRIQTVNSVIDNDIAYSNRKVAQEIASVFEIDLGFNSKQGVIDELCENYHFYADTKRGQVIPGKMVPKSPKLVPAEGDIFFKELRCTDNLMNMITHQLPEDTTYIIHNELEK